METCKIVWKFLWIPRVFLFKTRGQRTTKSRRAWHLTKVTIVMVCFPCKTEDMLECSGTENLFFGGKSCPYWFFYLFRKDDARAPSGPNNLNCYRSWITTTIKRGPGCSPKRPAEATASVSTGKLEYVAGAAGDSEEEKGNKSPRMAKWDEAARAKRESVH